MFTIALLTAFFALLVASWTDLRTREVPDWLNYGLIAAGVGLNVLASIVFHSWWPILYSAAGLGFFVGLGYVLFYAGQWGGGDSKLLMGMGALFGVEFTLVKPFVQLETQFLVAFLINLLLVGVMYALSYSMILAVKHRRTVLPAFTKQMERMGMMRYVIIVLTTGLLGLAFIPSLPFVRVSIFLLATLLFTTFYLFAFIKAVEKTCMYKWVLPSVLTEGDWIARDVIVDKKRICGPKDLGIEKKQIAELEKLYSQNKIRKVFIKEGIPFVPSFFLGFLVTVYWGNLFLLLL